MIVNCQSGLLKNIQYKFIGSEFVFQTKVKLF